MSKSGPLVSILINNYNKEKFCEKAVKSVLKQNYKKIEIIFFDDKSTDNSLKKINDYKKKNKVNLKIVSNLKKKKNTGPINQIIAIKKSLNLTKGSYVFLLNFPPSEKLSGVKFKTPSKLGIKLNFKLLKFFFFLSNIL